MGGGPLLPRSPGQEFPHKGILGWDPNCGDFRRISLCFCVFFLLLSFDSREKIPVNWFSEELFFGRFRALSARVWPESKHGVTQIELHRSVRYLRDSHG